MIFYIIILLVNGFSERKNRDVAEDQSFQITEVKPFAEQAPEGHLFVSDRIPSDLFLENTSIPPSKGVWDPVQQVARRVNYVGKAKMNSVEKEGHVDVPFSESIIGCERYVPLRLLNLNLFVT